MLKLTGPQWMTNCSNHINDIIVKFNFKWNGHKRCIHKEIQSATNECPTQKILSNFRQMEMYNIPAENGIHVLSEVILQGSSCVQADLLRKRRLNPLRRTSLAVITYCFVKTYLFYICWLVVIWQCSNIQTRRNKYDNYQNNTSLDLPFA